MNKYERAVLKYDSPPTNGWYTGRYMDFKYYRDGKFTGIWISRFIHLWFRDCYQCLSLRKPYYLIHFNPPGTDTGYDVIESPTIHRATKLAELYYTKWLVRDINFMKDKEGKK